MRKNIALACIFVLVSLGSSAYGQSKAVLAAKARLAETVSSYFDTWDLNHDGTLDEKEVALAVENPQTTGEAAAVAAALEGSFHQKKGSTPYPKFTKSYFESTDETLNTLASAVRRAESRLRTVSAAALFDPSGITLEKCKQGALGDCYLIAATGAVITRDPDAVNKMIHWEPEQSKFRVSYGDGYTVDVPALTQGEMAMGGASVSDGLWMRVMEKAWGIRQIQTSKKHSATDEAIDVMGHGGSPRVALEAMTGHKAKSYKLGATPKGPYPGLPELRAALEEAFRTHHLVVAGTRAGVTVPGISSNHAYAITGYDVATDTVQIWNPHVNKFTPKGDVGRVNGYPTEQGHFSMPLADFQAVYSGMSIETDAVKAPPVAVKTA